MSSLLGDGKCIICDKKLTLEGTYSLRTSYGNGLYFYVSYSCSIPCVMQQARRMDKEYDRSVISKVPDGSQYEILRG